MNGIYLNEIPMDIFLKYFNETNTKQTKLTPQLTNLKIYPRTYDGYYFSGNLNNTTLAQLSGLSGSWIEEDLESGKIYEYAVFGTDETIRIQVIWTTTEFKVSVKATGLNVSTTFPKYKEDGKTLNLPYVSKTNSGSTYSFILSESKNGYAITLSINGYLWKGNIPYKFISSDKLPEKGKEKLQAYYGLSSLGVFLSFYEYSFLFRRDGSEIDEFFQAYRDDNGKYYIAYNGEELTDIIVSKTEEDYNGFTAYSVNGLHDGMNIQKLIINKIAEMQAKTASGEFIYKDDLGFLSVSSTVGSNFARHRDAVRASYYDIRSMDDQFMLKMPPDTLGCIQKGVSYEFGYYGKYTKSTYYYLKKDIDNRDDTIDLEIFDKNVYDNAEKNISGTLTPCKIEEIKSMNHILDTEKLKTIDVIFDTDPRYSSYTENDVKIDAIDENHSQAIERGEIYLINPYIEKYKIFTDSVKKSVPLNGKITLAAKLKETKSSIDILNVATRVIEDVVTIAITGKRKNNSRSSMPIESPQSYIVENEDTIVEINRIANSKNPAYNINGSYKIYNLFSSNPYILIPVIINKNKLMKKDKNDSGELGQELMIENQIFQLMENGSNIYYENKTSKAQFPLYNKDTAASKFSISVNFSRKEMSSDTSIELYFMQLFLNSTEKESVSSDKLLGSFSDADSKTGYRRIIKYSYTGTDNGLIASDSFEERKIFLGDDPGIVVEKATVLSDEVNQYMLNNIINNSEKTKYVILTDSDSKKKYYIKKTTSSNIEDITEEIIELDVYEDSFYGDSATIEFKASKVKLPDVVSELYTLADNYYFGRKNILEENVYYNNKRNAIKSILMKAIDDPYDGTEISSEFVDANRFDEIRVYCAGLYSFLSNDRARETLASNSVRPLRSIDKSKIISIYEKKEEPTAERLNPYEPSSELNQKEAQKISDFKAETHIANYKDYPQTEDYTNMVLQEARNRDMIEKSESTNYENLDITKHQEKDGSYQYRKDMVMTYSTSVIERKAFSNWLIDLAYNYATTNGPENDSAKASYNLSLNLIDMKIKDAVFVNAVDNEGKPTEKVVIDNSLESDIPTLIRVANDGMTKLQ